MLMFVTLAVYFLVLLTVSRRTARRTDNDTFFRASRQSPWLLVGFGMIGASISGVSFISVPGWVSSTGMTYLQMCAGFFFGYLVVAFVLLPLYYRLRLTSIYSYLGTRFDDEAPQARSDGEQAKNKTKQARFTAQRTGALFFFLSKLTCAAARLYIVVLVLRQFILPQIAEGSPADLAAFMGLSTAILLLIWVYTRRSGIFTIVRTDVLQTACLLIALVSMIIIAASRLGLDFTGTIQLVADSPMTRFFDLDAASRQNFWRQFLSGIFIVIVMTGLDQSMMQKNLTCRTLREAQKNMCAYGLSFLPLNLLLLGFGVLLYALAAQTGHAATLAGDALLPTLVADGTLGTFVIIPFSIGIVAAAFASADSALAALTTSACIDLLRVEERGLSAERQTAIRRRVHVAVCAAFLVCILLFRLLNNTSLINAIYVIASYTYGPLLGLYAFGLFTRRSVRQRAVLPVCLAAPILCAIVDAGAPHWWGYTFGYELLMLNGLLTFLGLFAASRPTTYNATYPTSFTTNPDETTV